MRKRMHVYVQLGRLTVQQKLTEHCKSTIMKKIKIIKKTKNQQNEIKEGEFKFTNNTGSTFNNGWTIQLKADREIKQLWQGELKSLGNDTYQISNPSWDATWENGETITIGGSLGKGSGNLNVSDVTLIN